AGALALVAAAGFQLLPRSHGAAATPAALPASPRALAVTRSPPVAEPAPKPVSLQIIGAERAPSGPAALEQRPAPTSVSTRQPPARRRIKRSVPAIDEDGLAKPSF